MIEGVEQRTAVDDEYSRRDAHRCDRLVAVSVLGDALLTLLGLGLGYWLRFGSGWITVHSVWPISSVVDPGGPKNFMEYTGLIGGGACFLLITFGYLRLYEARELLQFRRTAHIIFKGATFWLFAYLGISLILKFQPAISRIYVFCSYFCCLGALLLWRWQFAKTLQSESFGRDLRQRILFVGWSPEALRLSNSVQADRRQSYEIVGYAQTPRTPPSILPPRDFHVLEDYGALSLLLDRKEIDIVILADLDASRDEVIFLANLCERTFVQFKVIPSYFQILLSGLHVETISGTAILGVSQLPLNRLLNRALKRIMDIVGGVLGLLFSIPIFVICGCLIYLESPGPILFTQQRIGRAGRKFNMLKLRSMELDAEKLDNLYQSTRRMDPRLLKCGGFMRKWNLDEVPQFWNVVKGEMSLVGPRPERSFHSEKLSQNIPHYNARYSTKPGMTGWAQVNGFRGDTSLVERVRYDLYYLENWSLWLDMQIMLQTFFRRENAF